MNERIREFAEQAGIVTEVWYKDAEGHGYKTPNYQAEKFAELIIQACSAHIRNRAMRAGGACTIVGEEALWLAKDLQQHFGVEE
jgi:hypothetical protein